MGKRTADTEQYGEKKVRRILYGSHYENALTRATRHKYKSIFDVYLNPSEDKQKAFNEYMEYVEKYSPMDWWISSYNMRVFTFVCVFDCGNYYSVEMHGNKNVTILCYVNKNKLFAIG